MHLKTAMKLMVWILGFQLIGFLLGLLTQANLYPWYAGLNKSSLTPPGVVFSVVWTLLYALLAIVAWILYEQKNRPSNPAIAYLFAIQMLMNWIWTPLFFQAHWLLFSAVWLVVLTALNGLLIIMTLNKQKTIALLLTPYLIWLLFAAYLNLVIAITN